MNPRGEKPDPGHAAPNSAAQVEQLGTASRAGKIADDVRRKITG